MPTRYEVDVVHGKPELRTELAEVLATALEALRTEREAKPHAALAVWQAVTKNWAVFLFAVSVAGALIGWAVFGISPFHPLKEIAAKQKEYERTEQQLEYKHRMVQRHIDLANGFLNIGQLDAARGEFTQALQLDPNNVEAHLGKLKAEVFAPIVNKEYVPEIAERRLQLILHERPDDPHVLTFLGDLYRGISKAKARDYYERALARDTKVAMAYAGLAVLYDLDRDGERAIKMYERALSESSWNQGYLNNLGYQYLLRGDYPKAIGSYDLLLNLDYRFLLSYYTLSSAYRLTGDLGRAMWYQDALIDLLDDEAVKALPRNAHEWFFHTDSRTIYFYDYPMKRCYAYYSAALTAYILGDSAKAESYVAKAKALRVPRDIWIRELVRYDVKHLQQVQKAYSPALDRFARRFL